MKLQAKHIQAVLTLFGQASPKQKLAAAVVLLTAVLGWWFGTSASHDTIQGKVIAVADGDTVTVQDVAMSQHRIRMAFIDAPEKAQPHGDEAKQHLSGQVLGQTVIVDVIEKDRYGRTVGRVRLAGADINYEMVRQGLAWHYTQYAKKQASSDYARYQQAQKLAEQQGTGLWQQTNPTPPWDFRQQKRAAQ